jgi:hypothetical protein
MTSEIFAPQEVAPPPEPASPTHLPEEMGHWLNNRSVLSFVYSRSMGGFIQTGRAELWSMNSEYLELRTADTKIIVVIRGAKYSTEPQLFFSPSFLSARAIPGVSISLGNFDWLFLCLAQDRELLVHGQILPGA